MTVFAVGGTTFGMAEESLAFYVLIITVMIAAGYDALVGASVVLLGCGIGVIGSTVNPFATGIASGFANIPLSDGLVGRLVILIVGVAMGIWFVLRYAERVRKDPSKSMVYDLKDSNEAHFSAATADDGSVVVMTGEQKVVLALFGAPFLVMVYGVIPWEDLGIGLPTLWWWFPEMTASFLFFAIVIGLVAKMKGATNTFVDGARDLLGVALIIGIARGITVVMNNGRSPTPSPLGETALGDVGAAGFAIVMYAPLPAAVVPHPVVVGPGHRLDADHGAARRLRRRLPRASSSPPTRAPPAPQPGHARPPPSSWAGSPSPACPTAPTFDGCGRCWPRSPALTIVVLAVGATLA